MDALISNVKEGLRRVSSKVPNQRLYLKKHGEPPGAYLESGRRSPLEIEKGRMWSGLVGLGAGMNTLAQGRRNGADRDEVGFHGRLCLCSCSSSRIS